MGGCYWSSSSEAGAEPGVGARGWEASQESLGSLSLFPHSPAPEPLHVLRVHLPKSFSKCSHERKSILKGNCGHSGHHVLCGGATCWGVSSILGSTTWCQELPQTSPRSPMGQDLREELLGSNS